MDISLRCHDTDLIIDNKKILSNISIKVVPGQVTAVIGPNGAGKSSLIKVMSGEIETNKGSVILEDLDISRWSPNERAKKLSVLPQRSDMSFDFTCFEIVSLGRIPHSSGSLKDNKIIWKALQLVGATELKERIYTHLSGGEKHRVQLARVIAQILDTDGPKSKYLLLDEPTATFDMAHTKLFISLLQELTKNHIGILLIAHDLNLAYRVANEVVLLHEGALVAAGPPDQMTDLNDIRRVFNTEISVLNLPNKKPLFVMD